MQTVYKYKIVKDITDRFNLSLPKKYKILKIDIEDKALCMWALIDTEQEIIEEKFITFKTGERITNIFLLDYIQSYTKDYQVWHVFKIS